MGSSRFAHGGAAHRGRRERGRLTLTRPGAGGKRYKHAAAAGTTAQAGGADVGAGAYKVLYEDVVVKTQVGIALYDITDHVNRVLEKSGVKVRKSLSTFARLNTVDVETSLAHLSKGRCEWRPRWN